jgi:hypothetical protein
MGMMDAQRQAFDWLLTHHSEAYGAVLSAWLTSLTAASLGAREQALHDYLQARLRCGELISNVMEGRESDGLFIRKKSHD